MLIAGLPELEAMSASIARGEIPFDLDTVRRLADTALFQTREVVRLKEGIKDASRQISERGRAPKWPTSGIPVLLNCLETLHDPEGMGLREPVTVHTWP